MSSFTNALVTLVTCMVFIDMDVQIQIDGWTDGWPRLFKTVANKKISK